MTKKARTGRRSKLTPELRDKVAQAIRAGNYAYVAAEYAGIGRSTFFRWLELGEAEESGPYRDFRDVVKRAECEAEVRAVATVQQHMGKNWQAAMTFLERKFPQRWGRRLDVTSAGNEISRIELVLVDPKTGQEEPLSSPAPGTTR